MNSKTKNIIGWVLAGAIALIFVPSAIYKLSGNADTLKMAESLGLSASSLKALGAIELLAVILFVIPRTGILGTLLLVAYMGGAIASHLEHGESIVAACAISAFLWVVAVFRFSELTNRILKN